MYRAFIGVAPVRASSFASNSRLQIQRPTRHARSLSFPQAAKMSDDCFNKAQRRDASKLVRLKAAELAFNRPHLDQTPNLDEETFEKLVATFTKGLRHDTTSGEIENREDFEKFKKSLCTGDPEDIMNVPLGPGKGKDGNNIWQSTLAKVGFGLPNGGPVKARGWESSGAGLTFDLEGPDAQAETMPPAPALGSAELEYEMAELYLMALTRDVPFDEWKGNADIISAANTLNSLSWVTREKAGSDMGPGEEFRRKGKLGLNEGTIFRGYGPGVRVGPYISQYLVRGSKGLGTDQTANGQVAYGALGLDMRVRSILKGKDWMTTWEAFVDVQNGANVAGAEGNDFLPVPNKDGTPSGAPIFRFIATPRDMATYVHFDALYEAYLNACFALLADKVPFDKGLPFGGLDEEDKQTPFATFGGPHILSLVCEVATRGLKAVRFQKYQVHRRARPEALGGSVHAQKSGANLGDASREIKELCNALDTCGILEKVASANKHQNEKEKDRINDPSAKFPSYLLPMAFPEGSPMHPSYGAGHGTVAGACTTILKAFFQTVEVPRGTDLEYPEKLELAPLQGPIFEASDDNYLREKDGKYLTINGELNKIANNVSFGRSLAGVHWSSDNIESLLLGEKIAIGILQEQQLTFAESHSFSFISFDGRLVTIKTANEHLLCVEQRRSEVVYSKKPVFDAFDSTLH